MFSKKDLSCFFAALTLVIVAYVFMIIDPAEYGFGILTLWIAPPLLIAGFSLPIIGIVGFDFKYRQILQDVKQNRVMHLVGVAVFAIAICTYAITLEPTASLWDCSEFIASAYKLQVPHSPGAPLFLLIARLFCMLVLDDVAMVALAINTMSAIFSALTVFITYHLIYYFALNMKGRGEHLASVIAIFSALCGSLCLTFSDSFWFSAVEAETYAAAAFFLMLLIWLIVTGKDLRTEKRARRLILIFYVAGLAYCVHPMCLLAFPLLPLCWYVKDITVGKFLIAIGAGLMIVVVINRLVGVGLFQIMFSFDKFFCQHTPLSVLCRCLCFTGFDDFAFHFFIASVQQTVTLYLGDNFFACRFYSIYHALHSFQPQSTH